MKQKAPPRILLLIDNMTISGAEKVALNLLHAARAEGLPWDAAVYMDDHIGRERIGIHYFTFSKDKESIQTNFFKRIWISIGRLNQLRNLLKSYDAVIPVTPPAIPAAFIASLLIKCRVIPWIHYDLDGIKKEFGTYERGFRDRLLSFLYTSIAPLFSNMVFVSESTLKSFAKKKKKHLNWVVIRNIFDRAPFCNEHNKKNISALINKQKQDDTIILSYIGRISKQKQCDHLLKVMNHLICGNESCTKQKNFALHVIGDGPERRKFEDAIEKLPQKVKDKIFVHGFVLNSTEILSQTDALLLTSLHEAWPTVILEAFHEKKIVFAYNCPSGPSEMIGVNDERGYLCSDSHDMALKIKACFENNENILLSKTQAAEIWLDHLDPKAILTQWQSVVENIINGK